MPLKLALTRVGPLAAACLCLARAAAAPPAWADPRLPARGSLELWLDAASENAARASLSLPVQEPGRGAAIAHDASGRGRHLEQRVDGFQPLYERLEDGDGSGAAFWRFDGIDDHLEKAAAGLRLEDFTVLVVAAPRSNAGGFRAFLAGSESGRNDYTSGLNVDLGPGAADRFTLLNVEGRGFGGVQDLLQGGFAFGAFHLLAVTSALGKEVAVRVDGRPAGRRPRQRETLHVDEVRLGARCFNNEPGVPYTRGFLDGEVAELLIFGSVLGDEELRAVESYLLEKHRPLLARPAASEAPTVAVFAPGFEVRELPIELPNVNALLYDPKGRLIALGYDGRVHALTDGDGDGIEDRAEPFWHQPTLRMPIAMAWSPAGLVVSSNGKVSRLVDADGDGGADREELIAEGWARPDVYSGGGVDAMGLALDADGALYFGLGCSDFTNAFRIRDGKAHYDVRSERGAILRVAPGGARREIVATGIRFPYQLAFNRRGDLFATDQEGETWLPGGNPLDELLHVQPGRHYGFPPRHAEHLPDVEDAPAAVEFGPQHQSTCGLVFNEPGSYEGRQGQGLFGPRHWEGDAFVAGYSRGKLWRVRLAKTRDGRYVGRPSLFASFRLLALAPAISPAGDLVIACHSGAPDWGSGPGGSGRLFKIRYRDPGAPQPALAWAPGFLEARVAFDRPVDAAILEGLPGKTIAFGEHVRAGDRHELHRPGYASVEAQQRAPRGRLRIAAAALTADGRTLVLTTDPHPARATYAVTLSGVKARGAAGKGETVELDYDLAGIEARLTEDAPGGKLLWAGWLPRLELEAALALARGSAEHDALAELLARLGTSGWSLRSRADVFESAARLPPAPAGAGAAAADLEGGDWARGREIFFGAKSRCSSCHRVRGEGGVIAPDLSNLVFRDAVSVRRDIVQPSAAIHPDYAGTVLVLADGRVLQGLVRSEGADRLRVFDAEAQETEIARSELLSVQAAPSSVMPEGLVDAAGEAGMRDLLVFLTRPPPGSAAPPPPPPSLPEAPLRSRAELEAILAAGAAAGEPPARPLNVVLVAGPKDHGPGEHDYPRWQERWRALLARVPGVRVSSADAWPDRGHWELADLMVFYFWNHAWSKDRHAGELEVFLDRGGGAVFVHSAVIPERDSEALAERIGLAWKHGSTKFRHGPLQLEFPAPEHPIVRGFKPAPFVDEAYWPLIGDSAGITVLATAVEEGAPRPMLWTKERGRGRVLVSILGHYAATFDDPYFRVLLLRGMAWAAREPIDRFRSLVSEGVKLRD
jgi:putative heme-binding domain-containing protein